MKLRAILQPKRRVSQETVAKFREIPTAVIGDCMSRLFAAGPRIRPMHMKGIVLAGPAYTVHTRPGDNLFIHKAIDSALAGDVIVVDAAGDCTNSLMGEMMLTHSETLGLAGVVLDGAIRDLSHVANHNFPVFAAGITQRGPYQTGPGEINVPISVGGLVVMPGDLIVGDDDGVICIPFDLTDQIFEEASKRLVGETAQRERVRNGTVDRKWIDERLESIPFPFEYIR